MIPTQKIQVPSMTRHFLVLICLLALTLHSLAQLVPEPFKHPLAQISEVLVAQ